MRGEFLKYVKDFKIINERICYLRLKAKCTSINVHTPTNEKTEEIKEEFYNLLEQNINQTANSNIKIILGDFNAKVGKRKHIQTHHWQWKNQQQWNKNNSTVRLAKK